MVTSGIRESFLPGSLPYDRVELNIDKKRYYQMHRNAVVLLSGNGEVVGANTGTGTQSEKAQLAIETRVLDKMEFEIETQDPREARSTTFVAGNLTTGNTYLTAPSDFLMSFSLAIIESFLINSEFSFGFCIARFKSLITPSLNFINCFIGISKVGSVISTVT